MSDAQKLIADVIGRHRVETGMRIGGGERAEWLECLGCGWESEEFDLDDTEVRREIERVKRAHLAAEIDKALGGLTGEWGVVVAYPPRPDDGYPGAVVTLDSYRLRDAAETVKRTKYPEDDYEVRSRWVSGWSVAE
ncbi:hypothetical protein [Mycobacterium sp. CnD-18-1]|uniref:hypothetical protein n=1 Tax=Mycobacterium sp. CnD-18-1 TaxID=2917744 RepID=UPI001EF2CE4A|nr:hypothetical protein [Mycobacterium sp. CnD-18-1]MCG7607056.1 hypothetical protein [Mycobacterium sp. CnD-18-1]